MLRNKYSHLHLFLRNMLRFSRTHSRRKMAEPKGIRTLLVLLFLATISICVALYHFKEQKIEHSLRTTLRTVDDSESTGQTEKSHINRPKIYAQCVGRFGNRLFTYVSLLGIAHQNNRTVVFQNSSLTQLKSVFPRIDSETVTELPDLPRHNEKHSHTFNEKLFHLPDANIRCGYMLHSFKYFQNSFSQIYDNILSNFEENLLKDAMRYITGCQNDFRAKQRLPQDTRVTTVCIHSRRGDFLSDRNIKRGFSVPSATAMITAMDFMRQRFPNSIFIIASNGLDWTKENLQANDVYFSIFKSVNQDFVLMSHCDHMIMTVGTFGWWGAWLTHWRGGTVLYYQHQFSKGNHVYDTCNRHDFFPATWMAYNDTSLVKSENLPITCD